MVESASYACEYAQEALETDAVIRQSAATAADSADDLIIDETADTMSRLRTAPLL